MSATKRAKSRNRKQKAYCRIGFNEKTFRKEDFLLNSLLESSDSQRPIYKNRKFLSERYLQVLFEYMVLFEYFKKMYNMVCL